MRAPALAGVLAPRGEPAGEREAARAAAALAAEGVAGGAQAGGLALAWTHGVAVARREEVLCLVEGEVHALREEGAGGEGGADGLAAAFAARGADVLSGLRGDAAIVLWDGVRREGLLARDQLGMRSLVWAREGDRLLFATEVRHLLRMLVARPGPDPAAVGGWLSGGPPPEDRTLFAGVRRLRPAHLLELRLPAAPRPYWRPHPTAPEPVRREEAVERLRTALLTAVRRRSPGGVLLSGGLDSASVAALAVAAGQRPPAYSATFPDHPRVDEAPLIALLERHLGLRGTRLEVRGGSVVAGALPYLRHWALPPSSPNLFFWTALLERAAADGTGALLDGEGGDEVFGHVPALLADRLRGARPLAAARLLRRVPGMARRPGRRSVAAYAWRHGVRPALGGPLSEPLVPPPWLRGAAAAPAPPSAGPPVAGPRWFRALVAATVDGPGPALTWDHVRRRAALAGLSARHPLLDLDVLELVLRLPPELAFDPARSRPLLRDAVSGLLPEEVRGRQTKSTFDRLFLEALAGPDLPLARALLGPDARAGEFVALDAARRELLAPGTRRDAEARTWAIRLWRLLGLECWLREQEEPGALDMFVGEHGATPGGSSAVSG